MYDVALFPNFLGNFLYYPAAPKLMTKSLGSEHLSNENQNDDSNNGDSIVNADRVPEVQTMIDNYQLSKVRAMYPVAWLAFTVTSMTVICDHNSICYLNSDKFHVSNLRRLK
jgi:hypothetical protein